VNAIFLFEVYDILQRKLNTRVGTSPFPAT